MWPIREWCSFFITIIRTFVMNIRIHVRRASHSSTFLGISRIHWDCAYSSFWLDGSSLTPLACSSNDSFLLNLYPTLRHDERHVRYCWRTVRWRLGVWIAHFRTPCYSTPFSVAKLLVTSGTLSQRRQHHEPLCVNKLSFIATNRKYVAEI